MKYVLMYTSRPDLAAGTDPEAAQLIYKRVYEWFGENAGVMADSGAARSLHFRSMMWEEKSTQAVDPGR